MSDREVRNIYAIPANYTDSGKLFGGLLEIRNTVEAILLVLLVGYPELVWIQVPATAKVIIVTVTVLPLGILALMGIGGDTLFEYLAYIMLHFFRRRQLHYKRIGHKYETATQKGSKKKKGKPLKKTSSQKSRKR